MTDGGGAYATMQQQLRRHPLRVMDGRELYELAAAIMRDKDMHHPGRCRRAASLLADLDDDFSSGRAGVGDAPCPAAGIVSRCNLRCDMGYWHGHGNAVGQLMARLARRLGKDPNLYLTTGVLHAIDYLSHPHDLGLSDPDGGHPLPLVRRLNALGAPRSMLMAILEYGPSTGLKPSGVLSHALRLCDAMVTCFEADADFPLPAGAEELSFLSDARGELRLARHADLVLVEPERVRRETSESALALADVVREKDVLRARLAEERVTRQPARDALAERLAARQRRTGHKRAEEQEMEAD